MSATAVDIAHNSTARSHLAPLRQRVKEWGHTLGTLAIMANMSTDTLRRKLEGHADFTIEELAEVCRTLGVTVSSLFGRPPVEQPEIDEDLAPRVRKLTATPELQTWAAMNLADLGERIIFVDKKVRTSTASDGAVYRQAFTIAVAPGTLDTFTIRLYKGASERDLTAARRIIDQAKSGAFHEGDWDRVEKFNGKDFGGWVMRLFLHHDGRREINEIRECTRPGCVHQFHAWSDGQSDEPCVCITVNHPEGLYMVNGSLWNDGHWVAEVGHDCDIVPDGPAGLRFLRDFANDFAWVQGECDRLNAGQEAAA